MKDCRVKIEGSDIKTDPSSIKKYEEITIDGETYVRRTKDWIEYQKEEFLKTRLGRSGIPMYVENMTLDSYVDPTGIDTNLPKIRKYLSEFSTRYKDINLYFWSHENGTQKTTTASILGKCLIDSGMSCRFVLMGDLIKMLSAMNEEIDNELVDQWRDCDFLIIDDSFDKKKATIYRSQYQISFLDQFLRKRLEIDRRATCFTSNFSIEEIDDSVFGISLKNLIRRSIIEPFEFKVPYSMRNDFNPNDLWK